MCVSDCANVEWNEDLWIGLKGEERAEEEWKICGFLNDDVVKLRNLVGRSEQLSAGTPNWWNRALL